MPLSQFLHPLFWAAFPVLFHYSQNAEYLRLSQLVYPLLICLGGAALLAGAAAIIFKKRRATALAVVSLGIILFFAVGPVTEGIKSLWGQRVLEGLDSGQIIRWWLAFYALGSLLIIAAKSRAKGLNRFFTFTGAVLVALQIGSIAYQGLTARFQGPAAGAQAQSRVSAQASPGRLPHIYYIILDGMGRGDYLRQIYGLQSKAFFADLQKLGFYVAEKSAANYAQTILSLASTLNYAYLDRQMASLGRDSVERGLLAAMIQHNRLFKQLAAHGYRIHAFASGCPETEFRDVDRYRGFFSQFNNHLIKSSLAEQILESAGFRNHQAARHRARILTALTTLHQPAASKTPVFVFAHLLSPHPPFVFGPAGEPRLVGRMSLDDGSTRIKGREAARRRYVAAYRDQARFIRQAALAAIKRVIKTSARPVAIILQGDHGPGSTIDWHHPERSFLPERLAILNAYRLPGAGGPKPYPTITPVNTFRLVLNKYFGAKLELLPDKSFFSPYHAPYRITEITGRMQRSFKGFQP